MKVITKMELQPDMVLGEDILDQDRVIYPAGTTITPQIIEKLKRYNLVCVTIMEDVDFATTHYAKIRFDSNFKAFERAYPLFLGQYKLAMKQLLIMGRKPADIILLTIYNELYYYITSGPVLALHLHRPVFLRAACKPYPCPRRKHFFLRPPGWSPDHARNCPPPGESSR